LKEGENMKVNGKSIDMKGITTISSLLSKLERNSTKRKLLGNIFKRGGYYRSYIFCRGRLKRNYKYISK